MDWTRDYSDSSIRKPRRRSRSRFRPVSRHRYQQSNSSEFFYDLCDSDSSTSKLHRFRSSNPFPRSYTWPSDKKGMNWFSSWFQVDLIDFLKRKRRHRQIKKEQKLARERSPERSPRLFVVDPPDRLESPLPRRPALRRAPRGRSTMEAPSAPEASTRHVPDDARSRRLETEQIRPRRPRERTPVAEREPPRRGRRVSPSRGVEVEVHQTRSPGTIRSNIDRRSPSPPAPAQVLEHATRPRATERRTSIPRISTTLGRDRRRYPITPVPGRSSRSLLRDMPRPRVVIHRIPRSQTRDIVVEPRQPREARIEIQERQPRVIQDGRSRLSSSANRVIGEAQPNQSSSVRFAEPFPTHEPEPRRPSRYRRRRERIVDERGAPVSRQR